MTTQKKKSLVLFLGAGFSKGLWPDIPLAADLTTSIRDRLPPPQRKEMDVLIRQFFPHLANETDVDFETFLGLLEGLCKDKVLSATFGITDPDRHWDMVVSGLGRAVHRSMRYSEYYQSPPLQSLIKILKRLRERYEVSVITTNYDLIADMACFFINDQLAGVRGGDVRLNLDRYRYGIHIRGLCQILRQTGPAGRSGDAPRFASAQSRSVSVEGIPVYKLHGSLNWAFCENCHEIDIAFSRNELDSIYGWKPIPCASGCGGSYKRLIVPPQPMKVYSNYELVKVWKRAEDVLAAASHVAFIGYSLNPVDASVIQLVLRGRAKSRQHRGAPWDYSMINPDRALLQRYRSLLGEPAIRDARPFDPAGFEREVLPRLLQR